MSHYPSGIDRYLDRNDRDDELRQDEIDNRLAEDSDEYGLDAPVFEDDEEFSAPIGDVSGPALLEILVALGAVDLEHTATWIGFALGSERFAIERGELWAATRELASELSEKIRRAAREREALATTGT